MASITNLAPKIGILLGDSITQQSFTVGGWGALLADNLVRRVDLLNRGFSGYNTKFAVDNLEHIFPVKYQPGQAAFATIFFGANDACVEKAQNGNFMTHHKQHTWQNALKCVGQAFSKF